MSDFYSDVDRSASPGDALHWQRRVDSWPDIQQYKRFTHDLLQESRRILDLGAGPGSDAAELGTTRCIGIDLSRTMCEAAAAQGVTVCQGDVTSLPCRDGAFDGVRADRVLQHVAEPTRALAELVRALDAGGRIVLADPDQESLSLTVPGFSQELCDRVKVLRRDVGYRNGRIATAYPALLRGLGVVDVSVHAFAVVLRDPRDAFGIDAWLRPWVASGDLDLTASDLARWEEALSTELPGFLLTLTYLVVTGVRGGPNTRAAI